MGKIIPFKRENRDIDNIYLELERLSISATDISAIMLEPDPMSVKSLKDGNNFSHGSPFLAFSCKTTKAQGLAYLEKYSGKFKFLKVILEDETGLFFDKNGFKTDFDSLMKKKTNNI